jgi:hypothetical protein
LRNSIGHNIVCITPIDYLIVPRILALLLSTPLLVIAGCLCFLAALGSSASAIHAAEPRTIMFFGDSLTAGYGLEEPAAESYPGLIQQKIDTARLPWRVVNAGLSGETTSGGARRIDWILRQPIDVFVLALGGNDGLRGVAQTQGDGGGVAADVPRAGAASPWEQTAVLFQRGVLNTARDMLMISGLLTESVVIAVAIGANPTNRSGIPTAIERLKLVN